MESELSKPSRHREWRRQVKKERRKRIRQKAARERDKEAEHLRRILESSEDYKKWQEAQETLQEEEEKLAEEEHAKLEKNWQETEVKAQKEWVILQERKAKAREIQLAQEEKIREEFEAMQENTRKRKEAERRRRDEQKKMFDRMKKEIDAYIDDGSRTPKALRNISETQPGKEICPFFAKTGACRYGDICSRNHQRPSLSCVVLIPNFYTHFSLERHNHDYDSDVRLEYDHRETRTHFRDFYFDVVPELEKFGKIKTLQYCRNTEPHLRGNLYVEFHTERDAARALRGLKGRWYAGRQLHCEFVNLKSWRGAICGMMRCPKGSSCNFLHVFRNPTEEYDVKSPPLWQKRQDQFDRTSSSRRGNNERRNRSHWEEHENQDRKNWRWSESPEPDDRRRGGGRPNQDRFRQPQRNFQQRNQFNNRNNMDNRRNDRNFDRRPRNFNDVRPRFSDDDRDDNRFNRQNRRPFNTNDRFKRRRSGSFGHEDYSGGKMRRRERRRSRSRSRSGSRSQSRSRSRSMSRSRSRSGSRSRSRSHSKSLSRSRTRSRSPLRQVVPINDSYNSRKIKPRDTQPPPPPPPVERSPIREKKRRPPSPPREKNNGKPPSKKPTAQPASKWDSEKREDSGTDSRDSRSRSASPKVVARKSQDKKNNSRTQHSSGQMHKKEYSNAPPGSHKSSNQKDYEWDTTDSEKD